jgi:hypothetical protein
MTGGGASPGLGVLGAFSTAGGLVGVGLTGAGIAGFSGSGGGVTASGGAGAGVTSGVAATGVAERYRELTQPMVPSRVTLIWDQSAASPTFSTS